MSSVGKPVNRADGPLKVTGQARYSADYPAARMAYAVIIPSTIARGEITAIDARAAKRVRGVVDIITHESGIHFHSPPSDFSVGGMPGNGPWVPLQDALVHFDGQQIGVAVADSLEGAQEAAALVRVSYKESRPNVDILRAGEAQSRPETFFGENLQQGVGDAEKALREPGLIVHEATYTTPTEHHNPMEPHATLAIWEGAQLTVYDTTQAVIGTQKILALVLGIPYKNVRVISLFLGGGFGCKGFFWPHTALAAAAARKLQRPIRLVLARDQMFTMNGHRPRTIQQMTFAARPDGRLAAIRHVATTDSSRIAEFVEPCVLLSKVLYACPNIGVTQKLVRLDTGTPTPMRAPGEATGSFAIECAMDELAYKAGIDPIDLRVANYADASPEDGKAWSSKLLRDCYLHGAEKFKWRSRDPKPRSMFDGRLLVGWGMATAAYPGLRMGSSARAAIYADGRTVISCATQDIGTGTYTILTQIAADALGVPFEQVRVELGNTSFPPGPLSGGSQTAASAGPAVQAAATEARSRLVSMATTDSRSLLHGRAEEDIVIGTGRLYARTAPSYGESIADVLRRNGLNSLDVVVHIDANSRKKPPKVSGQAAGQAAPEPDIEDYVFYSFGAQFVEVRVDPDTGEVRLHRMLGAYDVGRILNPKTARSQAIGGMTWGAGMALTEETVFDKHTGRIVTRNLADYRVPTHADCPPIEVWFTDQPDEKFNEIGARGLGELPITGAAAAIANAVFHATGKRVRDLPITPEKLI